MTQIVEPVRASAISERHHAADAVIVGYGIAGACAALEARRAGADVLVIERASGGFSFNREMVAANIPEISPTSEPFGIPYNDGTGIELGRSVGGALEAMHGVVGTASFYPPADLIKSILVNARGERFVAEDCYRGRTAAHIMQQPGQLAYLIVDSDIFAHPELEFPCHRLIDGWETIAEMETGLALPTGSLAHTIDEYNAGAVRGEDRRFHKHPEWLKLLTAAPYAAFEVSFSRSTYLYHTLGGLRTNTPGEVLNAEGAPLGGLYAVGGSAAHLPPAV